MTARDEDVEAEVQVTCEDGVAVLEIRRPPSNFFDEHLIGRLVDAAAELDEDPACRAIVLCSQGRHFCAGAMLAEGSVAERTTMAERLYGRAVGLFELRTPLIAAVQGAAVGGGLGLACAADFRVADVDARFVANFAVLGFHQGFGLSVTLPEIVGGQVAGDLLMRGGSLGGEDAHAAGLVDRLAPPGRQREIALAWATEFAAAAPLAVASIKQTLRGDRAGRVRAALDRELSEQARLWATEDAEEGIAAARQRRAPIFRSR